ncbi:hypothetical protein TIFTF001_034410 [Ficus carica]|uniref:Uncharacterized protein n=1 Tax=Ficus carica TaxID=3494 RepID=A0AA88E185_FICCA|nr:hypothetical protein TIFTF001_034410 [Ficus carica]
MLKGSRRIIETQWRVTRTILSKAILVFLHGVILIIRILLHILFRVFFKIFFYVRTPYCNTLNCASTGQWNVTCKDLYRGFRKVLALNSIAYLLLVMLMLAALHLSIALFLLMSDNILLGS